MESARQRSLAPRTARRRSSRTWQPTLRHDHNASDPPSLALTHGGYSIATPTPHVPSPMTSNDHATDHAELVTTDRFVPHISTVPATRGQTVGLFLREKAPAG